MPELQYQTGFGNEFATEAVAGVLPKGQSAPQKVALGLYAELWTGTAVYGAARDEPPDLGVPHQPVSQAQAFRGDPHSPAPQRPLR